jgi:hypothetical protein
MEIWRGQQEGLDVIIVNQELLWPWQEQGSGQKKLLRDYGIIPLGKAGS